MVTFLGGVATAFFLISFYGACVREWEHRSVDKWNMEKDFSGRVIPFYVRAWQYLFD